MTSRRSFFKRLASVVAVVALAPEIAFARKLEALEIDDQYTCVIAPVTPETTLYSTAAWPIDVGGPEATFIVESFSDS